ncbi:MAG: DegV family protein [Actinobacteria bacterium]|nr:DegV family protein [Actinomycetota bacterium]
MAKIAIVTDSTADMALTYYDENDVTMVPLMVRFGEEAYKDWIEMPPEKFYPMLRSSDILPKTSQPTVQEFIEAYSKYESYDHIFSIHLSGHLSGTIQSADIARQNVNVPVTVVDSKLASVGTAFIVNEAIKARNAGQNVAEMTALIDALVRDTRLLFCVDTLKYLELGGRIGKAQALAGSILNIKPILTLEDGMVVPFKKVKGRKKIFKEIVELLSAQSAERLTIGIIHADTPEAARELEEHIKDAGIAYDLVLATQIGSVIGTYVGPGAFGIMYHPHG